MNAFFTACGWVVNIILYVAFVILALSSVFRAAAEPTGFNAGMAVCWSVLGALYAVKAVREFRAADIKKEEVQHE